MYRKSAHMWTASQADLKEGGRVDGQAGRRQQRGRAGQAHILAIICVHHKLPGLCDAPPILQRCKVGGGERRGRMPRASRCSAQQASRQAGMAVPPDCCSQWNLALPQRLSLLRLVPATPSCFAQSSQVDPRLPHMQGSLVYLWQSPLPSPSGHTRSTCSACTSMLQTARQWWAMVG